MYSFVVSDDERPEFYFPDLNKSLENLISNSPVIKVKEFDLNEAKANLLMARSDMGIRIGINTFGQSIHEDRPNEDFNHRFRVLNQVYLKTSFSLGCIASTRRDW